MKDCRGFEMNTGDIVVFVSRGYKELLTGVITRFTSKKVYVKASDNMQSRLVEPRAIAVLGFENGKDVLK